MLRHFSIDCLFISAGILAWSSCGWAEVVIDTVTVGNPGNADDANGDGYGGVDYIYNIARFELTAGQYTEFLSAVAGEDTYALYNTSMWSSDYGCGIKRTGTSPNYSYSVAADWTDRPVNYVSWGDAARFANWMHNCQPSGAQALNTTEDGSYFVDGATSRSALTAITRQADATWVIPSEDEWYKAAYHKNDGATGNHFEYPTSSDDAPSNEIDGAGNNATFYIGDGDYTIGGPYYRTGVGAHVNSGSPYGTFDQGGNVWEWNEAVLYGPSRGLRGGSYGSDDLDTLHAAHRVICCVYPGSEDSRIGFRVAKIPRPACTRDGDRDGDGDVDLHDFAIWQRAFTGPR